MVFTEVLAFIAVSDLHYDYRVPSGEVLPALRGIDLIIQPGEFVGIAGPNGSGKSTLARHFNALLLPAAGSVIVDGFNTLDSGQRWDIRQRVAMVFSNPDNQLVAPVAEEDVAFGPGNLGIDPEEIERRVDAALEWVNMKEHRHRLVHHLSGGQKQRIVIAGALAMLPRYLILDEPTAMLDARSRRELLDVVHRLNRERGMTVILISHYLEELMETERLVILAEGQIRWQGTPEDLFRQPETLTALDLELPPIMELAQGLRRQGIPVPNETSQVEQLVSFLLQAGEAEL